MRQDMEAVVDGLENERAEFQRSRCGHRQVRLREVYGAIELTVIGTGIVVAMDATALLGAFQPARGSCWRSAIASVVRHSGHGVIELIVERHGQEARESWSITFTWRNRSAVRP